MPSNHLKHIKESYDTYLAHNYRPFEGFTVAGAYAQYVIDTEGIYRLDGLSCYGAVNFGHKHPHIVKAAQEALYTPPEVAEDITGQRAWPGKKTSVNTGNYGGLSAVSRNFKTDAPEEFAAKLCSLTGLDRMLPSSGGAEAVETAFKTARKWGADIKGIPDGRQKIIVAENCFHGRTISAVSASDEALAKEGFGPLTPGFLKVPFGDVKALENLLEDQAKEICAFVVEPVQGEGGVIVPPHGYLKQAQEACRRNNVLFILDEIQSGMGRTGKDFAFQHELSASPDGIILAKALSGGLVPLSAFVARKEVLDVMEPGTHGSTYGGNPLAARVGIAALEVLQNEHMSERSAELGKILLKKLQKIDSKHINDIRGLGLWAGIELKSPDLAGKFARIMCVEKHILCKDVRHTVRLSPPFVSTKDEMSLIAKAVQEICDDL